MSGTPASAGDNPGTPPQPLTHRRVLKIALPIAASGATVPLLGVVDTAVVGQLGSAVPIGAVGIGALILSNLYWIFGFLRMGTTGLVGQAAGAGNQAEVSALMSRALLIAASAGLALILLQVPIFAGAMWLSPASPAVEALSQDYVAIRIWSAPAAIGVFALTGWLVAMERAGAVLALQLVMNGVNIALDLLFVLGFGWGVSGVAVATVIGELSGCALGLWLCRGAFAHPAAWDWVRITDRAALTRMAALNRDILLRSAMLLVMFSGFMLWSARFGDTALAANHVLLQFVTIAAYTMDGFAHAAETLVARAVGRADRARLERSVWLCGIWAVGTAAAMAVVFALMGGWLIDLMTTAPDVRAASRTYLFWVFLSLVPGGLAFLLDGVFVGATRGADMRNMMAVSLGFYLAAVATLMPLFENHGLWAALTLSFVARAATLAARYGRLKAGVPLSKLSAEG